MPRRLWPSPAPRPPIAAVPPAAPPRCRPTRRAPAPRPRASATRPRRRSGRRPARRPPARSVRRREPRGRCRPAPARGRPTLAPACASRADAAASPACCAPARPAAGPRGRAAAPPDRRRRCHSDPAHRTRRPAARVGAACSPWAAARCRVRFRMRPWPVFVESSNREGVSLTLMAGVSLVKSLCSLRYRDITQSGRTLFAIYPAKRL